MSPPAPATLEDRARLTNYLRSRIRQDRSAPHRYPMATDGVMGARQFVLGFPSLAGERCRWADARLPPPVGLHKVLGATDVASARLICRPYRPTVPLQVSSW
jgi:hypothetical protein